MKMLFWTLWILATSTLVSFAHEAEITPEQRIEVEKALEALPIESFSVLCGSNGAVPFATFASSIHPKFITNNIDDTHPRSERRNYRICNLTPEGDTYSAYLVVQSVLKGDINNTLGRKDCIDILNAVEIKLYSGNGGKISAGVYCQIQ